MSSFDSLFSKPFEVDRRHLMEDIEQIYSFEKWRIPIVENMDNCIDERAYHTISFSPNGKMLRVEMTGTGISKEKFETLSTISFTTKMDTYREKVKGLGILGWGLKACMGASRLIEIETKTKAYEGRQTWFWEDDEPRYRLEKPTRVLQEDSVAFSYHLKDEFEGKVREQEVEETLKEFYPTVLAGAPVLGRKLRVLIGEKESHSPSWLDERLYDKSIPIRRLEVSGESVGGKVLVSKNELKEEERGIAIIVCGRNITFHRRENFFFDLKNVTGYVHADILYDTIVGDKTQFKRDHTKWLEFRKNAVWELSKILKQEGLIQKETAWADKELARRVYRTIDSVLKSFPELGERFGILGSRFIRKDGLGAGEEEKGTIQTGPSGRTDEPPTGTGAVGQLGGESLEKSLKLDEKGEENVKKVQKRVRSGIQVIIDREDKVPALCEAEYHPEGTILVNGNHPTFSYADSAGERARYYHVTRTSVESILYHLLTEGNIDINTYLDFRKRMIYVLGESL